MAAAMQNGMGNMMNDDMNPQHMTPQQQQQFLQQQATNNALTNQVKIQGQAIYNKQIANLAAQWGSAAKNQIQVMQQQH
ncbi:uncharacterized protein LY79DRAFT_665012 [Colletotrichum navitas]|uniref:Uncharacterized protein n=1 Tax=Colletotrichum navitas TaxID=681940 RepID=A0AAD8VC95_9PEZI|nr:uncharacterized protein LY79DRAFT_665012 [Colletotrichum navitas]KAK1599300.1 hypothetical protein LY79DRAFT_665012 [Colletotrichum navitas]